MRNKKLLSTVVASALVATTMAMPVMAADGGEVEVDVATKSAVIRVEVPTSLEVAVNQFEKGDAGSQIYSEPFGVKNKSEIPVKVSVTSTASLAASNPITLVGTKAAAASSTATGGEAWMAVAAQTSNGKYIETAGKGIGDLTEADGNVTTFAAKEGDAGKGEAKQIFYLSANATPTVTYTKLAPTNAAEVKTAQNISYAQIHEIAEITFTGSDNDAKQGELDAKLAAKNVYKIATAGSTDTISLIEKGKSETLDTTAGVKYYEDNGAVQRTNIAQSKIYVYGEAGDGGATAFRYIGKLGEGKETWTKDDISHIQIKYDIAGVTATRYTEISTSTDNPLINGLYKESTTPATSSAAEITVPATGNATAVVTIGRDEAEPTSLTTDWFAGNMFELTDGWGATYDKESETITFDSDISDALRNDTSHTFTVTFTPATGDAYTQDLEFAE